MLREAFPECITPKDGFACVQRTMQLAEPVPASELPLDLAPLSLVADSDAPAPAQAQESSTPDLSPSASPSSEPAELSPSESPSSESAELAPDAEEQAAPDVVEDPATRVAAENVFVVGDAADGFGAIKAGHNAFFQGEVAARNVLRLVRRREDRAAEPEALEKYAPGGRAIKVSLGRVSLRESVRGVTDADEWCARAQA